MSEIFLQRTSPLQQLHDFESKISGGDKKGPEFKEFLQEALQEVNHLHKESDAKIEQLLSGEITDVHSAVIAMQKADLSFQMMVQVRNKLIDAYHEIMRMQV